MKLLQYQEQVQGIPSSLAPERTTPDKWQPAPNIPQSNWQKAALYSAAAVMPFFSMNLTPVQRIEQPKTFSQQSVVITVPQTLQYQILANPVAGFSPKERSTPDKWQSQNNQPVFDVKRLQVSYPSFFANPTAIPNVEVITLDKWGPLPNQPLFDIKRQQSIYPVSVIDSKQLATGERITPDKWQPETNKPLFDVKRQQHTYPTFVVDSKQLATKERVSPDKWQPDTNKPIFDVRRQQYTYQTFATDTQLLTQREIPKVVSSEIIVIAKIRLTQVQRSNLVFVPTENVTLDKWSVASQYPIGTRRINVSPSFFFNPYPTAPETITADKWVQPQSLPQTTRKISHLVPYFFPDFVSLTRPEVPKIYTGDEVQIAFKRSTQYQSRAFVSRGTNAGEVTALDKWFKETTRPRFDVRRLQYTYPNFFFSPFPLPNPEVLTIDKWTPLVNLPVWDKKRQQFLYQTFAIDPRHLLDHERITLEKWFRETQQPRFDIPRKQYLDPSFTIDPFALVPHWNPTPRTTDDDWNLVNRSIDDSYTGVTRSTDANYNSVTRSSDDSYNPVSRDSDDSWNQTHREA